MRLVDGAEAIRGDLPSARTRVLEVPLEAGDAQGTGVDRYSSLVEVRRRMLDALRELEAPVIVVGGDCGVELAAVEHAAADGDVALVWLDAHPDLNTPGSSQSGAFHGMVLRAILGEGAPGLTASTALVPGRVLLAGVRAPDDAETLLLEEHPLPWLDSDDVTPEKVVAAVEATGASRVYVHIDLDVLDPGDIDGIGFPEPFGVPAARLVETVQALTARFPLAGAGITEFAPSSPDAADGDLSVVLRLIGALRGPRPA